MTREQIDALAVRLNTSKPTNEHDDKKRRAMSKPLSQEQLADMLKRLANAVRNKEKTPENQRTREPENRSRKGDEGGEHLCLEGWTEDS